MAMSRWAGGTPTTLRSPMWIAPSVGSSKPAMMLSKVDLPQPEGPTKIKNSPGSTAMSIFLSTSTLCSPLPKLLRMPWMFNADAMVLPYPLTAPAVRPRTK